MYDAFEYIVGLPLLMVCLGLLGLFVSVRGEIICLSFNDIVRPSWRLRCA